MTLGIRGDIEPFIVRNGIEDRSVLEGEATLALNEAITFDNYYR